MATSPSAPFLVRHEFLLRRLHSLTGLVPVGAYMVVHLATNATIWNGAATYQRAVNQIHSLGPILPLVEWIFIFLPILFHGLYGFAIMRTMLPNNVRYNYSSNVRYTFQRISGLIAFLFIMWHVFHMHGWIHNEQWREFIKEFGAQFAPFNAATTATSAVQSSFLVSAAYLIGVIACVFHLANGLWTMGITWGLWTTPEAQRKANYVVGTIGVALLGIGVMAWAGFALRSADFTSDRALENKILESRLEAGQVSEQEAKHKRARPDPTQRADASQNDSDQGANGDTAPEPRPTGVIEET